MVSIHALLFDILFSFARCSALTTQESFLPLTANSTSTLCFSIVYLASFFMGFCLGCLTIHANTLEGMKGWGWGSVREMQLLVRLHIIEGASMTFAVEPVCHKARYPFLLVVVDFVGCSGFCVLCE